jgi:hypothetical protein
VARGDAVKKKPEARRSQKPEARSQKSEKARSQKPEARRRATAAACLLLDSDNR